MPAKLPEAEIESALAAIDYAQSVRRIHRRRTEKGSEQREADIELALGRLRKAMKPLRSEMGRFPYGPQTDAAEDNRDAIREISRALQAERRKLWKMRQRAKEA